MEFTLLFLAVANTWALIGFIAAIILLAAVLLFDRQFEDDGAALPPTGGLFAQAAVWLVIGLTSLNVISTLLECGFAHAPTIRSSTNCSSDSLKAVSECSGRVPPQVGQDPAPANSAHA